MKINSLILTNSGFKTYFDNRFIHFIQLGILLIIGIYFSDFKLPKILTIISFSVYSILFYLIYKLKIGQIYSLGFFYQILLFFFLLPTQFFNPITFFLTFTIYFIVLFKENVFLYFPFPVSLFLVLLNLFFIFAFSKLGVLDFFYLYKESEELNMGLKLVPIFFQNNPIDFQINQFSTIEKSGILIFISVFVLILKNKDYFYEILSILCFGMILFLYYKSFFIPQFLTSIGIWYIFHFSLGKNNSVLKIFTFTSILFIFLVLLTITTIKFSLLEIIAIYYTIYSLQFLLVKKFHFQKNLFLKIENKL